MPGYMPYGWTFPAAVLCYFYTQFHTNLKGFHGRAYIKLLHPCIARLGNRLERSVHADLACLTRVLLRVSLPKRLPSRAIPGCRSLIYARPWNPFKFSAKQIDTVKRI